MKYQEPSSWAGFLVSAVMAAVILYGTLLPSGPDGAESTTWCGTSLLCGGRGIADALVNVLLFLPLGIGLRAWTRSTSCAAVAAVLFSMSIETAQIFIPGRMPGLGDVVFDGLGAILGACVAASAGRWLHPTPRVRSWLSTSALALALGTVAATGVMGRMDVPPSALWVQWTPRLPFVEHYRGRVLSAFLDGEELGAGAQRDPVRLADGINQGAPLEVRFVTGPPPTERAPLLRIVTGHSSDVAILAITGEDVVLNVRRASNLLQFGDPSIVFPGALAEVPTGHVTSLRIWKDDELGYCMALDDAARPQCGAGMTAGTGWAMLLGDETVSGGSSKLLDLAWLALLFTPAGLLTASAAAAARAAGIAALGLLLLPHVAGLLPTPALQVAAALLGIILGALGAELMRRVRRPRLPAHGGEPATRALGFGAG